MIGVTSSWCDSIMVAQLHVGISKCMRERRSLHDLTCFSQSTVVAMLISSCYCFVSVYLSLEHTLGFVYIMHR